jgi:hypothetical protein
MIRFDAMVDSKYQDLERHLYKVLSTFSHISRLIYIYIHIKNAGCKVIYVYF